MPEQDKEQQPQDSECVISLAEFYESIPPGAVKDVVDLAVPVRYGGNISHYVLASPEIQLHCPSDACNGVRFFRTSGGSTPTVDTKEWRRTFVTYACANCKAFHKTYAIAFIKAANKQSGNILKLGEDPVYGPPTPPRLIKLIGPDRDAFLKGRRCENQGLGIGAFIYYRRVVVNQKNRILDEIIKVSKKFSAPEDAIAILESAQKETQFSKALENVQDAVPQALLIDGHNPLRLLHSALSDGLHDRSDEECLELASSVRIVLAELSERLSQALKDEAELKAALSRLVRED